MKKRYRWTTVMHNGKILRPDLLTVAQVEAEAEQPSTALSIRDAHIIGAQTAARRYGGSRGNVRRKDGVERLAGCA